MRYIMLAAAVALLSCAPVRDHTPPNDTSGTALPIHYASYAAAPASSDVPPVAVAYVLDAYNVTVAGDSLKVVLMWEQPTDGLGNVDSTVSYMRVTKPIRFYNDTTQRSAGARIRRRYTTALADSFKLKKPALGDSVIFTGDSIFQCRKGPCSVPGSWAFKYIRTAVPPPMTVVKIVHDSF